MHRCPRCEARHDLCFCSEIPVLAVRTQVRIVLHAAELPVSSNTGRLAAAALRGASVHLRGRRERPLGDETFAAPGRRLLLLFPSAGASVLSREFLDARPGPYTLLVPDGTWRQARKLPARERALDPVERVLLPPGPLSRYRLRVEPRPECVSTIEAVARALEVLEGPDAGPAVRARLEALLEIKVERTIRSRAGGPFQPSPQASLRRGPGPRAEDP